MDRRLAAQPGDAGHAGSYMKRKTGKKKLTLAEQADRHFLYEKSVQDPENECRFVYRTFRALRGRKPRILREDFCGTAAVSCEWVRRHRENRAIGIDLDPEVLEWARAHNVSALKPARREHLQLVQGDVLTVTTGTPVDLTLAMNFSYMIFKTRSRLLAYFSKVREGLAGDGVFILDAFGGYEAYKEMRETTKHKGFSYIWEHARFNPISGEILCYIHFRFRDGSRLKRAFSYDWRLWTLPELRELLLEAGFSKATVYWEQVDEESGEGTGEYRPSETGDADPGWVCFIVAEC